MSLQWRVKRASVLRLPVEVPAGVSLNVTATITPHCVPLGVSVYHCGPRNGVPDDGTAPSQVAHAGVAESKAADSDDGDVSTAAVDVEMKQPDAGADADAGKDVGAGTPPTRLPEARPLLSPVAAASQRGSQQWVVTASALFPCIVVVSVDNRSATFKAASLTVALGPVPVVPDVSVGAPVVLRSRSLLMSCLSPAVRKAAASFTSPKHARAARLPLSAATQALVDQALDGLDASRIVDHHVHVVGLNFNGSGCWVSPRMTDSKRACVRCAVAGPWWPTGG